MINPFARMEAVALPPYPVEAEQAVETKFEGLVRNLRQLLEENDPETFSPAWINGKSRSLYKKLANEIRGESGDLDWTKVVDVLGRPWSERWLYEKAKNKRYELHELVERLAKLLDAQNPATFNSSWIEKNDASLSQAFYYKMKRGQTSWDSIISSLDEKWKERWKVQNKIVFPESQYKNPEEVADAIERDKLYVFSLTSKDPGLRELMLSSAEVDKERQEIIEKLINLSKKGNVSAQDTLMGLIMPIVEDWVEHKNVFAKFVLEKERLEERIRRCIYLYKPGVPFLRYLYSSLALESRSIKDRAPRVVSMDAPLRADEAGSMHDRLGQEDASIGWEEGDEVEESAVQIASKKRGRTGIAA